MGLFPIYLGRRTTMLALAEAALADIVMTLDDAIAAKLRRAEVCS